MHPSFFLPIEFEENISQTLIIENPKDFSELIYELRKQINGEDGKWVLSQNGEPINITKKCEMIIDPFSVDLNERKLLTALYSMLEKEIQTTELLLEWNTVYPFLVNKMDKLISSADYMLSYKNDIEIKDFFKIMNLQFLSDTTDFFEKLLDYLRLAHEVLNVELFIFVNIKGFLNESQLHFLKEQSMYQKFQILLIESYDNEMRMSAEKVTIIDKDSCVIQ